MITYLWRHWKRWKARRVERQILHRLIRRANQIIEDVYAKDEGRNQ